MRKKTIKPQDILLLQIEYDIRGKPKLLRFYLKDDKEFFLNVSKSEKLNIYGKTGFYVNIYIKEYKLLKKGVK